MPCNVCCEQICAINVDAPELSYAVERIVDCFEVLGKAGGGYEIVDFAVLRDDICKSCLDRFLRRDVCVVGCDIRYSIAKLRIFLFEGESSTYLSAPGFSLLNDATNSPACLAASSSVASQ